MRIGVALIVALVALVACGKKSDSPSAGSAVGSAPPNMGSQIAAAPADAAAAAGKFCVDGASAPELVSFAADDKAASFCLKYETGEQCATVDLATGEFARSATRPPAPAEPTPPFDLKQGAGTVEVCKAGACTKLDLPKLKAEEGGEEPNYMIAQSADGKTIAAAHDSLKGFALIDATTGKKKKVIKITKADYACVEPPQFLGDSVYIQTNVCAGPGATGHLFTRDGKKLGAVDKINPNGDAVQLEGTTYAFAAFSGGGVQIVDVATGKTLRTIEFKVPDDCADCSQLANEDSILVKTPGGKLVMQSQLIDIADPKTGKVEKTIHFPACPKPT